MADSQRCRTNLGNTQSDRSLDIPIDDPEREKRALEQGGWADHWRYLVKTTGCQAFSFGPHDYADRISEVYRRCFEPENNDPSKAGLGRGKLSVLSDFAAHFPQVIFRAEWVQHLMTFKGQDPEVLRALANGFRNAVGGLMRQFRKSRLEAARIALSSNGPASISEELRRVKESIDLVSLKGARTPKAAGRKLPRTIAEVARTNRERIKDAVRKLIERYPVIKPREQDIIRNLEHGHVYAAKVLVVSKLFGVSPHSLHHSASILKPRKLPF